MQFYVFVDKTLLVEYAVKKFTALKTLYIIAFQYCGMWSRGCQPAIG